MQVAQQVGSGGGESISQHGGRGRGELTREDPEVKGLRAENAGSGWSRILRHDPRFYAFAELKQESARGVVERTDLSVVHARSLHVFWVHLPNFVPIYVCVSTPR